MTPPTGYALVTGASSGIGECFARAIARRKQNLILVARTAEKIESLAAQLRSEHGIIAEVFPTDLSEPGAAGRLCQRLSGKALEVDLLVNNAGFGAQGEFWTLPLDRQAKIIRLNIQALVELSRLLIPEMLGRKRGGIINVSSTASFQPLPYSAIYAATKAFVTSFSCGLAEELRSTPIRVVTLCPGTTRTRFFEAGEYTSMRWRGGFQAPERVADAGLLALDCGGGFVITRRIDRFLIFIERFIPRRWITRGAGELFKP
jgi:uncharacterized protein